MIRWKAEIIYRHGFGPVDVAHDLEELGDIHDVVERGPHWDTIESITIKRVSIKGLEGLTVEEAGKL